MKNDLKTELNQLYRKWPVVRNYLKDSGCRGAVAEDIFQEALLIYVRKKEEPDFILTTDPVIYVRQVCKFLWYNQVRKDTKFKSAELAEAIPEMPDNSWLQKELLFGRMEKAISVLGKQCQQLLQEFYGLGRSMAEIAASIGMKNERVAKVQKYRCLQKAKELVLAGEEIVEPEIYSL